MGMMLMTDSRRSDCTPLVSSQLMLQVFLARSSTSLPVATLPAGLCSTCKSSSLFVLFRAFIGSKVISDILSHLSLLNILMSRTQALHHRHQRDCFRAPKWGVHLRYRYHLHAFHQGWSAPQLRGDVSSAMMNEPCRFATRKTLTGHARSNEIIPLQLYT